MGAAAFSAGERGGENELACDKRIGLAMSFAERVNAGEGVRETGGVADDSGVGFHKFAKFSARLVSEAGRGGCRFRREARLGGVIAQPRSDSPREHHRFQQ